MEKSLFELGHMIMVIHETTTSDFLFSLIIHKVLPAVSVFCTGALYRGKGFFSLEVTMKSLFLKLIFFFHKEIIKIRKVFIT